MGSAAWETVAWISFCNDLCALFSSGQPTGEAAAYLSFDPEGATEATGQEKENQQVI
jgi:hypothetical protein